MVEVVIGAIVNGVANGVTKNGAITVGSATGADTGAIMIGLEVPIGEDLKGGSDNFSTGA